MKKRHWLIISIISIVVVSFAISGVFFSRQHDEESNVTVVPFHVSDGGIFVGVSRIDINNYSPGRVVNVIYRFYNETSGKISPSIYPQYNISPADYEPDYSLAPADFRHWLDIENPGEIQPGEYRDFTIKLEVPKSAKIETEKWGCRIAGAGNTGGFTQTGVAVWWLVDMR